MKKIYKYSLNLTSIQDIKLPKGAEILSCKTQDGFPQVWALIDSTAEATETYEISIIGTGHDASRVEGMKFLDTFLIDNDSLVFHAFYKVCFDER